ncbi:MAG: primosomal protein N' [Lachnospiraceae bacterium]|nr:primosomal protein N' [Lachnospiraceae bacterium]
MSLAKYANIIVDISHSQVDRPFQYRIPAHMQDMLEPGMCVQIPFGKGNTLRKGYCLELTDQAEYPEEKLKDIAAFLPEENAVENRLIRLAYWMKKQYGSTMITALKTVLPVKQKVKAAEKRELVRIAPAEQIHDALAEAIRKHQTAKERVLRELLTEELLPYELVTAKLHVASPTLKSLEKQGLIRIDTINQYRNPVKQKKEQENRNILSEEQLQIVTKLLSDFDRGVLKTYLLHGITGSGKTEVYMLAAEEMVKRGRQVIVLIPEIALTYQTVLRFYKRFGDRVSVMNSSLSAGEKYDQCERARHGEIDVIIGPRSALFTPFPSIGLIIMDEEHESSYKSENMPKYHARETAIELAKLHGASVLLGSATPSLEAYYRARQGEYELFTLNKRLTGGTLPAVYTIDLREELREGNRSVFSRKLQELVADRLQKKEQSMLFLNRRGYAGFISCRACGHVLKCPHCDVSLSEHRGGRMICHYCGYETKAVKICPECGSKYIMGFRAGTEQIEEQIKKIFPTARTLRMDADTTRTKNSYEQILTAFSNEEADILIGTQMIVKGHDFPKVTLVGILAADMSLSVSDYRASERTFDLLTQAAGRAGRGDTAGEVVIQTYQPEHYSIMHAAAQDYEGFYQEEITYRELLSYPPASHMLAVQVTARNEGRGKHLADALAEAAGKKSTEQKALYATDTEHLTDPALVIGPAAAAVSKINDIYRFVFFCKHQNGEKLIEIKDKLEEQIKQLELKDEMVQFDFDPINGF